MEKVLDEAYQDSIYIKHYVKQAIILQNMVDMQWQWD